MARLRGLAIAAVIIRAIYGLLIVLARRLPKGAARDLAAFIVVAVIVDGRDVRECSDQ